MSQNSYKRFRCSRCKQNLRVYRSFFPFPPRDGDKILNNGIYCSQCGLLFDTSHLVFCEKDYPEESAKQRARRLQHEEALEREVCHYTCPNCGRQGIAMPQKERSNLEQRPDASFSCKYCQVHVTPYFTSPCIAPGHEEHDASQLHFEVQKKKKKGKRKKKKRRYV